MSIVKLKETIVYVVDTLAEADDFIVAEQNEGTVSKVSKEHKVKKEEDFYIVTVTKKFDAED